MDNSNKNGSSHGAFRVTSKTSRQTRATPPVPQQLARDKISLEAVINVLLQQGMFTEEQLSQEEARLRAVRRTMSNLHFQPVRRTRAARKEKQKKHPLKQWAAQRRWARQIGSFVFGWKWRKFKKKEKI